MNTIKYKPLQDWLKKQPTSKKQIVLSFQQIESILSSKMPASASDHEWWWSNEGENTRHPQSVAWFKAGWKVESLDLKNKAVTFKRV